MAWKWNHCSVAGSVAFTHASLNCGVAVSFSVPFQTCVSSSRVPLVDRPHTESAGNVVLFSGHVHDRSDTLKPIPMSMAWRLIGIWVLASVWFTGVVNDISGSSSISSYSYGSLIIAPPSRTMSMKPVQFPSSGGLWKLRFSSSAPCGVIPPRDSDPVGQMLAMLDSFRLWNDGTSSDDPATTSMSIQNLDDSPSTDQPCTATPYRPSCGLACEMDSDDVPPHDLVTSSPEEKTPSPSSSRKRKRSKSLLSYESMVMLSSVASSIEKLCHQDAVILSLGSSWKADWLSRLIGRTHPCAETDSAGSGIVDTTRALSLPSDSDQSETVLLNPDDSAEM